MSFQVITRFPPSPTGPLHIGNVRTALFNYLFATQNKGQFVVRIEDTDKVRSKKEYEDNMLDGLTWLGLSRDGELWHQSERGEVYKGYLKKLIDEGRAYLSKEAEGENREVVRFKNPNTTVTFTDLIRGEVSFDTSDLGDFIIARNINEPVYHLAVVIDDFETKVTHIIRGEDHVSNTPRQILIQQAIGAPRPIYAHLPLILAKDRSKLSKRKHGESVSLDYYRQKGYLPEALVNYMALLGWNPGTDQEIFSMEELVAQFNISKIQKGGAVFDEDKLRWVDSEHRKLIEEKNPQKYKEILKTAISASALGRQYPQREDVLLDVLINSGAKYSNTVEQISFLDEAMESTSYSKEALLWKDEKDLGTALRHIQWVIDKFQAMDDSKWSASILKEAVWDYATKEGRGNVLWPTRIALSCGLQKSTDPFVLAHKFGKEESLRRLKEAQKLLQ